MDIDNFPPANVVCPPSEYGLLGAQIGQYVVTYWIPASQYSGVGELWIAHSYDRQSPNTRVVIKTPKNEPIWNEWRREVDGCAAMSRLPDHPNLMRVYGVGEQAAPLVRVGSEHQRDDRIRAFDGQCRSEQVVQYIVLEHCVGGDLFDLLPKLSPTSVLPHGLAAHFFKQLMEGVRHLHKHGIAHRDIKNDNILVDSNMNLKIGDFGFMRILHQIHANDHGMGTATSISVTPMSLTANPASYTIDAGTCLFHDPRQQGVDAGRLDPKKQDIWCCAHVLVAMLTGAFPFGSEEAQAVQLTRFLDDPAETCGPSGPNHYGYWLNPVFRDHRGYLRNQWMTEFLNEDDPECEDYLRAIQDRLVPPANAKSPRPVSLLNRMFDRNQARRINAVQVLADPWLNSDWAGNERKQLDLGTEIRTWLAGGNPSQVLEGIICNAPNEQELRRYWQHLTM